MRDRADELSVLNYRASRHECAQVGTTVFNGKFIKIKVMPVCFGKALPFYILSFVNLIISRIYFFFFESSLRISERSSDSIYSLELIALSVMKLAISHSSMLEIAPSRSRLIYWNIFDCSCGDVLWFV